MKVLGLDVGTNSLGWALVDEANQEIIDIGSYVFPMGVNKGSTGGEQSKNLQTNSARGSP
jgi:CRISPR-associated endonuclease Csn1